MQYINNLSMHFDLHKGKSSILMRYLNVLLC